MSSPLIGPPVITEKSRSRDFPVSALKMQALAMEIAGAAGPLPRPWGPRKPARSSQLRFCLAPPKTSCPTASRRKARS